MEVKRGKQSHVTKVYQKRKQQPLYPTFYQRPILHAQKGQKPRGMYIGLLDEWVMILFFCSFMTKHI
jgi:hypothetical protein